MPSISYTNPEWDEPIEGSEPVDIISSYELDILFELPDKFTLSGKVRRGDAYRKVGELTREYRKKCRVPSRKQMDELVWKWCFFTAKVAPDPYWMYEVQCAVGIMLVHEPSEMWKPMSVSIGEVHVE